MDFSVIVTAESLGLFWRGLLTTLELLVVSLTIGLVLSVGLAVLRNAPNRWLSTPVWAYTYVIRGTPMLLQLYLIYYGLSQFAVIRDSALWPWLSQAWVCAALALVVNTAAYTTELIAGAMRSLPHGEIEAAHAVGMGRAAIYRHVVLPAALRRALPAYSNEVMMVLHSTSLASTVTLLDLTAAADRLYATYYMPFEPFIAAAGVYVLLTFILVGLFKLAERRWLTHLQPRRA